MKRKILIASVFALLLIVPVIALPISAKSPNQIMLSEPDFVLNILGKDHFTDNPMQDSPDRHTIFVPLEGGSQILISQAPRGSGEASLSPPSASSMRPTSTAQTFPRGAAETPTTPDGAWETRTPASAGARKASSWAI